MIKSIKWNCKVCGIEYPQKYLDNNNWCCYKCKDIKEEVIKPEEDIIVIQQEESSESFHGLPLYTSSYLHNKLKINLNSIKKETCCVKVWDKYILHTDIIFQFKKKTLWRVS